MAAMMASAVSITATMGLPRRSTAAKRSTARRSRVAFPKPTAASYSTDDVYKLLDAINKVTLKRMEDEMFGINDHLDGRITDLIRVYFNQMRADIQAIKTKVGALTRGALPRPMPLPNGSAKGSRGRARKRKRWTARNF